ncbi:MAG TPA: hypothetical protein VMU51_03785 [Mycobacteriales bacterium]|nr:hypothetical protein [Mycobacteriales bacterium]
MPSTGQYTVWVHDAHARARSPFPLRGQARGDVLARLGDLPAWADSVFVFDDHTSRQVFLAFVDRVTSLEEGRVALDIMVTPESWAASLPGHRRRTASNG